MEFVCSPSVWVLCSRMIDLRVALLHFLVVENRHSGNVFSPQHRIWHELSLIDDSELSVGVNVNVSICLYTLYQPCDGKATCPACGPPLPYDSWNRLPPLAQSYGNP